MRFDAVVFDSGGTLFENPEQRRVPGEPTCSEIWATRFSRVAGCLQGLRLPFDPYQLEKDLAEVEAVVPKEFGRLYSYRSPDGRPAQAAAARAQAGVGVLPG